MPRKPATPVPEPAPDPLADLRDPEARYPDPDAQEGQEAPGEADPLQTLLGEAIGRASMCWEPTPEGVFHSEAASAIVDDLLEALRPATQPAMDPDEVVERWHENTVALGFLHKGGRCGCAYIARVAFGA